MGREVALWALAASLAACATPNDGPAVTEKGLAWLASRRDAEDGQRWFLWLHYFDPHTEYLSHPGVSERFG